MALKVPDNDNGALNQKELNQNIYLNCWGEADSTSIWFRRSVNECSGKSITIN